MARRSKHEHLKPMVLALAAEGRKPSEICQIYPGIPTATVYVWAKEVQGENGADSRIEGADSKNESGDDEKPPSLTVLPPLPQHEGGQRPTAIAALCPVDGISAKEELRQVRRWLWKLMQRSDKDAAIAFQGAHAYLKAIQIELGLETDDDDDMELPITVERRIVEPDADAV